MACLWVAKGVSHLGLLSLLGIVPLKASSVNMPASKKKGWRKKGADSASEAHGCDLLTAK